MEEHESVVRDFMAGWSGESVREVYDKYLAEECVWMNTGFRPRRGKEECMRLVDSMLVILPKVQVELHNLASNGQAVFVQRTDHCFDADGKEHHVADIAAVFEVHGGQIVSWHEYFDPTYLRSFSKP